MATSVMAQLRSSLAAINKSSSMNPSGNHHHMMDHDGDHHGTPDTSASSYDDDHSRDQQQQQQQRYDNSPNPAGDDEFHLTIPSVLTQSGAGGLARMDQKMLSECMQPVVRSLQGLDAESLLNLERVQNGARLCDGVNVRPIHDEVFPRYDSGGTMSCVRYIHITEVPEQYSIGIFVFPPFSRIPLHDHPEMCVLSRLLYGDLQCLSLDLPEEEDESMATVTQAGQPSGQQAHSLYDQHHPNQHPHFAAASDPHHPAYKEYMHSIHRQPQLPPGLPQGSRRAFKNSIKHLHAPDVSLLFPYKGNLHEFYAGPHGAAVLDILLPPYDCEHDRDCTFYDVREDPAAASAAAAAAPDAMMVDDVAAADERTSCWIVPTQQPHDFHCLSGKYQKLGTNVITMED